MVTLDEALKQGLTGLYYGNRIILPFTFYPLKIVMEKDIISDFSSNARGAEMVEHKDFIDLYFFDYPVLREVITKFENIKMVIVEKDKDIFDFGNHRKIALYLKEKHQVTIEETDKDILFLE